MHRAATDEYRALEAAFESHIQRHDTLVKQNRCCGPLLHGGARSLEHRPRVRNRHLKVFQAAVANALDAVKYSTAPVPLACTYTGMTLQERYDIAI